MLHCFSCYIALHVLLHYMLHLIFNKCSINHSFIDQPIFRFLDNFSKKYNSSKDWSNCKNYKSKPQTVKSKWASFCPTAVRLLDHIISLPCRYIYGCNTPSPHSNHIIILPCRYIYRCNTPPPNSNHIIILPIQCIDISSQQSHPNLTLQIYSQV